jgi:hypothetical protein
MPENIDLQEAIENEKNDFTRRGLLKFLGANAAMLWVAKLGIAQATPVATPHLHITKSRSGEPIRAWVREQGQTLEVRTLHRAGPEGNTTEFLFTKGHVLQLTLSGTLVRYPKAHHLGEYRFVAKTDIGEYSMVLDATGVTLDRHVASGLGKVQIKSGTKLWEGELDFNRGTITNLNNAPRLDEVVSKSLDSTFAPLIPALKAHTDHFDDLVKRKTGMDLREQHRKRGGGGIGGGVSETTSPEECVQLCYALYYGIMLLCNALLDIETWGVSAVGCAALADAEFWACMAGCPME